MEENLFQDVEVEKRRQTIEHKGKRVWGREGVTNISVLVKCKVHGVGVGREQEVTLARLTETKAKLALHFC